MKHTILLIAGLVMTGTSKAEGGPSTPECYEALNILHRAMDRLFDHRHLPKDSCLVVDIMVATTPREGAGTCAKAMLQVGKEQIWFTTDEVMEYIDTKNHVYIWPGEQRITMRPGGAAVRERALKFFTAYQGLLVEQAHVLDMDERTDKDGRRILRLTMTVDLEQFGGNTRQIVELDMDRGEMLTWEIFPPVTQPLRSLKIEYGRPLKRRLPAKDPLVRGLLALQGPVSTYKNYVVVDDRNRK